jgi:hypothetical protein
MHKPITCVADLLRAISAGWVLHDVPHRTPSGTYTASSDFILMRGTAQRKVGSRIAHAAISRKAITLDIEKSIWTLVPKKPPRK